ncbi:MAG: transcription-repair coupling factor [Clostridiales Family XIII bacterium]|jgi:transcription-repair coupling factor (superfamily II helicase)|nr:transcription-repair coupling factor [Clostridiales Family XIII bacterium]
MGEKTRLTGLSDLQSVPVIAEMARELVQAREEGVSVPPNILIVTATAAAAASFAKNYEYFSGQSAVALPEDDAPFQRYEAKSSELAVATLAAESTFASMSGVPVIAPVSAAIKLTETPDAYREGEVKITVGDGLSIERLRERLAAAGYRGEHFTENPGEASTRGGIVDIFPMQADSPYRIEFFGNVVDSIRSYDPETQLATGKVESVTVSAAFQKGLGAEAGPRGKGVPLFYHAGSDAIVFVIDPTRIESVLDMRRREAEDDFLMLLEKGEVDSEDLEMLPGKDEYDELLGFAGTLTVVEPYTNLPENRYPGFAATREYRASTPAPLFGQMDLLAAELKRYRRLHYDTVLVCGTPGRAEKLKDFLDQKNLSGAAAVALGEISGSIEIESLKKVWLSDADIYATGKKARRPRIRDGEKIKAFSDISHGDYVVHERYGIGVYRGLRTITADGKDKDFLTIAYTGTDVLYIPVDQISEVQRYIGSGERKPKISRLGTDEWVNTKKRVQREIEEYATELLAVAARRKLAKGFSFEESSPWQGEFEDRFPYEPTPDQQRCFESVARAMAQEYPMDMLICGDVGYGKTEVALRAAFRAVMNGKQVAMLVPTTILAAQHGRTFEERFKGFPAKVKTLSRFLSFSEKKVLIAGLKTGEIDVVIGTHALLGKNVGFKDLGLLVIDEEQRFGVKHKEKVKALKAGVDVITLTATPIPRTLQMSLTGMRDMELIADPPDERLPVRTYVAEENEETMAESIRRELDRGGQAYVVFNRISGIDRVAGRLSELVPEARFGVCHAAMHSREIERLMLDFLAGDFDVLVSTSIIESGLDIPNVNTILIMDSDRFGLTQLYQLRGRVGRMNRTAFAWLLYRRDKILTESAEKRLKAIREFTEFGAGFKIAMKDLEMRGAGNLLGVSQSGHMVSVGFEYYCKMLDEAVRILGGENAEGLPPGDKRDMKVRFDLPASIPESYVDDEVVKLLLYNKIAALGDEAEAGGLKRELEDRFGPIPEEVDVLILSALVKNTAFAAGASSISVDSESSEVLFDEPPEGFAEAAFKASEAFGERVAIFAAGRTGISLFPDIRKYTNTLQETLELLKIIAAC